MRRSGQVRPGTPPGRRLIEPGGRVEMRGVPLFLLIMQAWDLNIDPDEELPGKPKWLKPFEPSIRSGRQGTCQNRFEIGTVVSEDDFNLMLRALLADRFRMAVHYEDRPMDAYTLVGQSRNSNGLIPRARAGCKTERAPVDGTDTSRGDMPEHDLGSFRGATSHDCTKLSPLPRVGR